MPTTKTIVNVVHKLRKDTLANWQSSTDVLYDGEIAVAVVANPAAGEFDANVVPTIGIKVGDGTHTFSQLPWIQAVAGDVYAWAKAATKPTYAATEITGLDDYISGVETEYQIVGDSTNHQFKLQAKGPDDVNWTDVSTISMTNLGLDVADTAVAGQLVSAVSETNGVITVTRRALVAGDIPDLSADKITSGTLPVERGGTGAATLASGEVLVGNGTGAVQTKAIDSAVTEDSTNLVTSGAVYTAIEDATEGLTGAMHFIGVATIPITDGSTVDPAISGYNFNNAQAGDVITYSGLEFVWNGSAWTQLGDEASYALKTVSVSAGSGLTGGGNLTADRTISHAVPSGAGTGNDVSVTTGKFVNKIKFDEFGHVVEVGVGDAMTYTFAEGTTDGAFTVTPDGGTAQTVPIHGLDNAAYRDVAAAIDNAGNASKLAPASLVKDYTDTAISGLATIASTGNINDLVQTSGDILVLDGGNATSR